MTASSIALPEVIGIFACNNPGDYKIHYDAIITRIVRHRRGTSTQKLLCVVKDLQKCVMWCTIDCIFTHTQSHGNWDEKP